MIPFTSCDKTYIAETQDGSKNIFINIPEISKSETTETR